jgi:hypothetical protein
MVNIGIYCLFPTFISHHRAADKVAGINAAVMCIFYWCSLSPLKIQRGKLGKLVAGQFHTLTDIRLEHWEGSAVTITRDFYCFINLTSEDTWGSEIKRT